MKKFARLTLIIIASGMVALLLGYIIMNALQETIDVADVRSEAPGNFITLDQGITRYKLDGVDTAETIVFVHGGGAAGMEIWDEIAPFFIDHGYKVLIYDLYGRGYSDYPDTDHTPELFNRQLTQLVDTLHIKKPFTLVSNSLAAIIALDYMQAHPENVSKAVFLDPTATGEFKLNTMLKIPVAKQLLMTGYWYPRTIKNQRKDFVNKDVYERYAKRLAYYNKFKGHKAVNYSTWTHMLNQNRMDVFKGFPADRVLLIYGKQDPYFPEGNVPIFKAAYPSLQISPIDSTGHLPHLEKPMLINETILGFLKTH